MNLPGFFLGMVMSALYGTVFHFWRGGGLRRLVLFLLLSIAGFWVGQMIGAAFNLTIGKIGTLLLAPATIGSFLFLLVGNWLFNQA